MTTPAINLTSLLASINHRVYSQYNEDVTLLALFGAIGTSNRFLVDIGAHDGYWLSNTLLLRQLGWHGLLFDCVACGNPANHAVHQAKFTAENINRTLLDYGCPQVFDFLSLDIDGNDYWVWANLGLQPRVICVEWNECIDPASSVTIEYDPNFTWQHDDYHGASYTALVRLGQSKGYTPAAICGGNILFVHSSILPWECRLTALPSLPQPPPHKNRNNANWIEVR